jgi:hypothetical protein
MMKKGGRQEGIQRKGEKWRGLRRGREKLKYRYRKNGRKKVMLTNGYKVPVK